MSRYIIALIAIAATASAQLYIEGDGGIVVELDQASGSFGIGDSAGRRLTYDFHYPWIHPASHFVLRVDSTDYCNNLMVSCAEDITPYIVESDMGHGFLYTIWEIPEAGGAISLTQTLTPVMINGCGQIKISYFIYNSDDEPHTIGLLLNQDLVLHTNDRAPIAAGGVYSAFGRYFGSASAMPYFWQAYQISPSASENQLVAAGFLRGLDATTPGLFAFGDQMFLLTSCWDVDSASLSAMRYVDSGLFIRWNTRTINPDKFDQFVTYFGLGESHPSTADAVFIPLSISEVGTECSILSPNPFEVAVLLHNQGISAGIDSIVMCIHLPAGLSTWADVLHSADTCHSIPSILPLDNTISTAWLVMTDTTVLTSDTTLNYILTAESSSFTEALSETLFIHIPHPTGIPPYVEPISDFHFLGETDDTIIYIPYLVDSDEPLDTSTLLGSVDAATMSYFTGGWHFAGDTLLIALSTAHEQGDTSLVEINRLDDIAGCAADGLPLSDTIFWDFEPPVVDSTYPRNNRYTDTIPRVYFHIADTPAGFDPTSLYLIYGSEDIHYGDSRLSFGSDYIIFQAATARAVGSEFDMCIADLADRVTFPAPNRITTPFCLHLTADPAGVIEYAPKAFEMITAYPNPFNSSVKITVGQTFLFVQNGQTGMSDLPVTIEIYDLRGNVVGANPRVRPDDVNAQKGQTQRSARADTEVCPYTHTFIWQPDQTVPSGIYLVSARLGTTTYTKHIVYLK